MYERGRQTGATLRYAYRASETARTEHGTACRGHATRTGLGLLEVGRELGQWIVEEAEGGRVSSAQKASTQSMVQGRLGAGNSTVPPVQ